MVEALSLLKHMGHIGHLSGIPIANRMVKIRRPHKHTGHIRHMRCVPAFNAGKILPIVSGKKPAHIGDKRGINISELNFGILNEFLKFVLVCRLVYFGHGTFPVCDSGKLPAEASISRKSKLAVLLPVLFV